MARKNNFPTGELSEVPAGFTQEVVSSLKALYDKGRPDTDEETEQRLNDYFSICDESSVRPGVETMRLALCVSRQTLSNWEKGVGCSKQKQDMIVRAKSFVTAYIEQLMLHNKIFPGSGCFFLKNWAGYRDSFTIDNAVDGVNQQPNETREQIATRYAGYIGAEEPEKPDLD